MKRHALFVGVDKYADPTIQNLAFPTKDAIDLAGAFEWSLKFDRVEKLANPEHADDILDVVGDMTEGLEAGDLFFFFFAGHGFRVKDNHVLVCAKDNWCDLEDEDAGLRVGRLKKRLRGPWNRMIVLDACQNDIRATRGADCGVTARDLSLIHSGDAAAQPGEGVQILVTSCSEGQKALEVADLRHGLFTSAFLETVKTFADEHRFLDPGILKEDLSGRMQRLAVRYSLVGSQEPMFTIPGNTRIVLLDGVSPPPLSHHGAPVAPALVVCPVCGKKNEPKDTFKCKECGRDDLCLRHQDEDTFLCMECTTKKAKEAEIQRKAAEDAKVARAKAVSKPNGQYRETVDGRTWNFEVKAGKATIGSAQHDDDTVVPHASLADEPTGDVVVPPFLGGCPVIGIGDSSFAFCERISSVTMPHGIVDIGNSAFEQCRNLKSIQIPTSVKHIGASAFECCSALVSIEIPDTVELIGKWAFTNCRALASVTIPQSISSIGDSMFACCRELAAVVIPDGVTSIGDCAFQNCESLENVEIPEGLVSIGEYAFQGCDNLKEVSIPASVAYIGEDAFPEDVVLKMEKARAEAVHEAEEQRLWNEEDKRKAEPHFSPFPVDDEVEDEDASAFGGADESADFDVKLCVVPADRKISVMTKVRDATGLGLAETKMLVENLGVVRSGIRHSDAQELKARLEAAGAKVEVVQSSGGANDRHGRAVDCAAPPKTGFPQAINRNDPCPCGSGKKFKNCHGRQI